MCPLHRPARLRAAGRRAGPRADAASVRQEPGNLRFDPYTQAARPAEFFVFEVYRDEAAFQAHLGADHGARFNAELADLILEDASVLSWLVPLR